MIRKIRERSLRRWMDDIKAVAGVTWTRTANNREKWKKLEEAFTNKWQTTLSVVVTR